SAFQRTTCSAGPNTSCVSSLIEGISYARGAKKVPCSLSGASLAWLINFASRLMRLACSLSVLQEGTSITGPTSVESSAGSPTVNSSIAPFSISITLSAMSSCTNSTRAAEQRWPAESNALAITSFTSCSGNADESAINAFCPPVSAISAAIGALRAASVRLMVHAVSVDPVKHTPATSGRVSNVLPSIEPLQGTNCSTISGTPASYSSFTIAQPTSVV